MAKNENTKGPVLDLIGGSKKKKAAPAPQQTAPVPAAAPQEAKPRKEALDLLSAPKKKNSEGICTEIRVQSSARASNHG